MNKVGDTVYTRGPTYDYEEAEILFSAEAEGKTYHTVRTKNFLTIILDDHIASPEKVQIVREIHKAKKQMEVLRELIVTLEAKL